MPRNHTTTDELAAMIERDLAHKEDIEALSRDMAHGFETIASSMRTGFEEVTDLLRKMHGTLETIAKEKDVLDTDHGLLEKRVTRLEKRLHQKA